MLAGPATTVFVGLAVAAPARVGVTRCFAMFVRRGGGVDLSSTNSFGSAGGSGVRGGASYGGGVGSGATFVRITSAAGGS